MRKGQRHTAAARAKMRGPRVAPTFCCENGCGKRVLAKVRAATVFDAHGLTWTYEPQRFYLGTCSYLPDFYLPTLGVYVEVKGYMAEESAMKIARFRQRHPELPLVVVQRHTIEQWEALNGCPGLEDQLDGLVAQQCAIATA